MAQASDGVKKRMTIFTTAPDVILLGRETIYRNGVRVGWLSSAGFGHTIGKSIGMGFVRSNQVIDRDFILSCTYELEVASQRVPCQARLSPLYDPEMLRVRGKRYAYQRPTERISAVRSPVGARSRCHSDQNGASCNDPRCHKAADLWPLSKPNDTNQRGENY